MILVGIDFLQGSESSSDMSVIRIEVSISAGVADAAKRRLVLSRSSQ